MARLKFSKMFGRDNLFSVLLEQSWIIISREFFRVLSADMSKLIPLDFE